MFKIDSTDDLLIMSNCTDLQFEDQSLIKTLSSSSNESGEVFNSCADLLDLLSYKAPKASSSLIPINHIFPKKKSKPSVLNAKAKSKKNRRSKSL